MDNKLPNSIDNYFPKEISIAKCHACHDFSIWVDETIVYPKQIPIEKANIDMNEDIQALYGLRPNIHPKLIIPNLHSILESIKETGGVSVLPEYLCEESIERGKIVLLYKLQSAIENRLYLSYEEGVSNRLLIQNLLGVLG